MLASALEIYDVSSGIMHVSAVNGRSTTAKPLQVAAAAPAPVKELQAPPPYEDSPAVEDLEAAPANNSSPTEVVSSEPTIEEPEEDPGMTTSLRPRARPQTPRKNSGEVAQTSSTIFDMRGCVYGRGSTTNSKCYKSMSTKDRARRVMSAVNFINQLHKTQFDGRYMLCTGYRESNFNPGARGRDGERGMFQVMKGTGKAALRYGVELQEFKGLDSEKYMTKMSNSTVAQVELSFLVLQMKLIEDATKSSSAKARQQRIMSGQGTVEDYRRMAGRYNGGGYNSVYAKRISNCYSCLRGKMSARQTNIGNEIQTCLNKAK